MDVRTLACRIAATGLDSSTLAWPSSPLSGEDWRHLMPVVQNERLGGLLASAVDGGMLPVTAQQARLAHRLQFAGLARVLVIEAGALPLIGQLTAAGVDVRVLKGSAVAHLDYPDPAVRHFIDLDLMVPSDQFDRAVDVFTTAGYARRHRQPRPGFDRRFSKGTSFTIREHLVVDLHRTFVMGPFGLRVDLRDLWRFSADFTIGGTTLRALDRDVRFLHACFHAALGDAVPRLVPQRDVVQMLLHDGLDTARVRFLTEHWRARAVVAKAVADSWRTLQITARPDLVRWALTYRPTRRESYELALYSDPTSTYARKSIGAFRAVPGVRDKVAFAFALAFPDRSYVEGRYDSRSHRLTQGIRTAAERKRQLDSD